MFVMRGLVLRRVSFMKKEDEMKSLTLNESQYDVIQKANSKYERYVKNKNYSKANCQKGYLDGLCECKNIKYHNLNRVLDFAKWNLNKAVDAEDYGKSAYWLDYIFGFETMKSIIESFT